MRRTEYIITSNNNKVLASEIFHHISYMCVDLYILMSDLKYTFYCGA